MLTVIFIVLLLSLAVLSVVLRKTYGMVPVRELRRQAATGNDLAHRLYQAVGYGLSLRVLLWLTLALASAGGFVMLVQASNTLVSMLVIATLLWLNFSWLPSTRVSGLATRVTLALTPAVVWVLHYTDSLIRLVAGPLVKRYQSGHSGLYELNDLLDLLELQSQQPDNRITAEEISMIRQVLTFGDKKVRDVLRPRAEVKSVALNDTVGPILLDELHASGQTTFPVKKTSRSKEIVGSLQLGDLGIHTQGKVADYITEGTTYINDEDSLAVALHQFYRTKQQLFVVLDNHQEFVGVLTLEDILHQLVGRPAADESPEESEPAEELAETAETVVE